MPIPIAVAAAVLPSPDIATPVQPKFEGKPPTDFQLTPESNESQTAPEFRPAISLEPSADEETQAQPPDVAVGTHVIPKSVEV